MSLSAGFEGSEPIAEARLLARSFLADEQNIHGLRVSDRALDLVELVVSELVTNTRKYAPGPSLLTLQVRDGCVDVTVWDSNPDMPTILPPDPTRAGQHGLEIIMASALTFQLRREPVGKRITASILLADDLATDAAGR
ncbi:ATP-binding protein [Streptomyces erythrochromogenes]|uniref:ATP-binding protein n=1 Tax=Streptomyces erythrochromogenes TaxID=285574 RepID=UPI0038638E2D|nr:ATP-binding protein [Streptomyces erythrochromogenes]